MEHKNDPEIRALAGVISKALQHHGIEEFHLDYTGADDSTDGFDVMVTPTEKQELAASENVQYQANRSVWTAGVGNVDKLTLIDQSLEDATYELAGLLWDRAGQSGWYNNEGGGGHVTVFPGGTFEFRHYNNIQNEEESCHWRANIFAGPINADYEEVSPEPVPA